MICWRRSPTWRPARFTSCMRPPSRSRRSSSTPPTCRMRTKRRTFEWASHPRSVPSEHKQNYPLKPTMWSNRCELSHLGDGRRPPKLPSQKVTCSRSSSRIPLQALFILSRKPLVSFVYCSRYCVWRRNRRWSARERLWSGNVAIITTRWTLWNRTEVKGAGIGWRWRLCFQSRIAQSNDDSLRWIILMEYQ